MCWDIWGWEKELEEERRRGKQQDYLGAGGSVNSFNLDKNLMGLVNKNYLYFTSGETEAW